MNNISASEFENKAAPRVIVSLTTYPGRIDRVNIAIESLLHQTRPADMVVLWLAGEQFPGGEESLPAQLLALKARGLRIEWCRDIKSFKKLIPAVEKWPEDIIITADDDIIYRVDTIEKLLESYQRHPDCVSTVRAHLMQFDGSGYPLPYDEWKPEYSEFIDRPLMCLFPTTGAGTLFPPGVLPEEIANEEAFMSLCPKADDIWTKCMLTLAGVPVVLACENTRLLYVEGTQTETLYSHNLTGNDAQLKAVLDVYNEVGGEEHSEETLLSRMNDLPGHQPEDSWCQKHRVSRSYANEDFGVKVSVIIAARNAEKTIKRCIASALGQSIADIEIVCVDAGSADATAAIMHDLAAQDQRVKVIELSAETPLTTARKAAVLDCRGEYCIFPEATGILAPDACEQLYNRAKNGDTDILAFTRGLLAPGAKEPQEHFGGYHGRLRNKNIMPQQFSGENIPWNELHSCIFGARLCRKAYIHADAKKECGSLYDYFLLCRNAEVYVGEDTPVYYASQSQTAAPETASSAVEAIAEYARFARLDEAAVAVIDRLTAKSVYEFAESWIDLPHEERGNHMNMLAEAWPADRLSAAIYELYRQHGPQVIRVLDKQQLSKRTTAQQSRIGVAVLERNSATELFNMTEVLDCIAINRSTALIGVSKSAASAVVSSAKAVVTGAGLNDEEAESPQIFASRLSAVIKENELGAIVVSAHIGRYMETALLARLMGVAVVAMLTEPLCQPMADCSEPGSGLCGLALADIIISDSEKQTELLRQTGLNARFIPMPAIRLMGGRSSRATASTVVWTGRGEELSEACAIFERIKAKHSDARMQAYADETDDIELLAASAPEGMSVRRLRPDHGIFADAAVHLMTRATGTAPASLRAAATLGVPTVMYQLPGEDNAELGVVSVERCDAAAAADAVVQLLKDKDRREQLAVRAKAAASANSRELTAARWDDALNGIYNDYQPEEAAGLGQTVAAMLTVYEDGAYVNTCRFAEYDRRCQHYEQQLAEAEERRIKETEALKAELEKKNAAIREKEHARADASRQLEELRASTMYKVGSAVTALPRRLKKLISGGKQPEE